MPKKSKCNIITDGLSLLITTPLHLLNYLINNPNKALVYFLLLQSNFSKAQMGPGIVVDDNWIQHRNYDARTLTLCRPSTGEIIKDENGIADTVRIVNIKESGKEFLVARNPFTLYPPNKLFVKSPEHPGECLEFPEKYRFCARDPDKIKRPLNKYYDEVVKFGEFFKSHRIGSLTNTDESTLKKLEKNADEKRNDLSNADLLYCRRNEL